MFVFSFFESVQNILHRPKGRRLCFLCVMASFSALVVLLLQSLLRQKYDVDTCGFSFEPSKASMAGWSRQWVVGAGGWLFLACSLAFPVVRSGGDAKPPCPFRSVQNVLDSLKKCFLCTKELFVVAKKKIPPSWGPCEKLKKSWFPSRCRIFEKFQKNTIFLRNIRGL